MNTNYTEYFRNRMAQHDRAFKKIVEQIYIPRVSKKRNFREAFNHEPTYTRFADEATDLNSINPDTDKAKTKQNEISNEDL